MKIIILVSFLILSACSSSTTITSRPLELNISQAADPQGVQMAPIDFKVITRENLDAFLAEISSNQGGASPVFIAISPRDYDNLLINLADLRRYIEQQQAIIVYYRRLTEPNSTRTPQ